MPYIPPKVYWVVLFCGCRREFPYFSSSCTAIRIGDVVVCGTHKGEQVVKSVSVQETK